MTIENTELHIVAALEEGLTTAEIQEIVEIILIDLSDTSSLQEQNNVKSVHN